jgi:hypothetical protein
MQPAHDELMLFVDDVESYNDYLTQFLDSYDVNHLNLAIEHQKSATEHIGNVTQIVNALTEELEQ